MWITGPLPKSPHSSEQKTHAAESLLEFPADHFLFQLLGNYFFLNSKKKCVIPVERDSPLVANYNKTREQPNEIGTSLPDPLHFYSKPSANKLFCGGYFAATAHGMSALLTF